MTEVDQLLQIEQETREAVSKAIRTHRDVWRQLRSALVAMDVPRGWSLTDDGETITWIRATATGRATVQFGLDKPWPDTYKGAFIYWTDAREPWKRAETLKKAMRLVMKAEPKRKAKR